MIEIGAGGGSIARVDELGLLRVGPDSAAANPGPACYGLGGDRPTVTDADLMLGYLDEEYFLGGGMRLDRERAAAAIRRHVAEPLDLSPTRAAWGIHAVVNDNMARAAKVHCLERGKDARNYVLLAYGGAGPVHAAQVAAALGIKRVMYPLRAGVMSALGFLAAPARSSAFARTWVRSTRSTSRAPTRFSRSLRRTRASSCARRACPPRRCVVKREAALRFAGQSYGLPVPLPPGRLTRAQVSISCATRFIALYRKRYYRLNPDVPVELVNWRVSVSGPKPELAYCADRTRRTRRAQRDAPGLFRRSRSVCRLRGL